MKKVMKIEERCDNASYCGARKKCPTAAIIYDEDVKKIRIDYDKCISCGKCVYNCPRGAVTFIEKE